MILERPGAARGRGGADWLDSRHTFSFGQFHDPAWMGFGPLRVINEDRVAPGAGFPPHDHANMEILSYVLSGALAHRDSSAAADDAGSVLRAGQLQWMSAGHGITHSEYNASSTEPVHFLQVWIQPDRVNAAPAHARGDFDPAARRGRWVSLASPDGEAGSLPIRQQAWLRATLLARGEAVDLVPAAGRRYWLHLARGGAAVAGRELTAGDALGLVDETGSFRVAGAGDGLADVLVFDLPA